MRSRTAASRSTNFLLETVAMLVGAVGSLPAIRWGVGGVLLALGISRFFRHRHPRWVGMQVGLKDLTVWSFLMASATAWA